MMANLNFNKHILAGRLTGDPELKTTPAGVLVTSFSIAVNRRGTKETDFIDCVAWKEKAQFITTHFEKGSSILISGPVQKRTFTDKKGYKRYAVETTVDEVYFVDSKKDKEKGTVQEGEPPQACFDGFDESELVIIPSDEELPF